jgi:uncharacterized SAM-binding protein YcdF (DUF218 family)
MRMWWRACDPAQRETYAILIPQPDKDGPNKAQVREATRWRPMSTRRHCSRFRRAAAAKLSQSGAVKEGQEVLFTGYPIGAILGPHPATHRAIIASVTPIAIPLSRAGELSPQTIRRLSAGQYPVFQLDATAYPGNSGSPLYDPATGEVIGVINKVFVQGTKEAALTQPSGITTLLASHLRALLGALKRTRPLAYAKASQVIDPIWVKAVLKALVLLRPVRPAGIAGLALWRRSPRRCGPGVDGVLSLLLLSLPAVRFLLIRSLDIATPFDRSRAAQATIVILGGGTRRGARLRWGYARDMTLERVRYGARIARLTGLPVLVTGGSTYGGATEAELMQEALQHEFDVPVRWAENRSRTTHENAQYSAAVLRAAGIGRVVLVAHAFDMRRATAEFAAAGIATVPAATGIPSRGPARVLDYVPGISGLQGSYYALYEILGNAVRVVTP